MKPPRAIPTGWGETDAAGPVAAIAVSRRPAIYWGPSADAYPLGPASHVAAAIGNRRAYFLISPSWHRLDRKKVDSERDMVRAAQSAHPEHLFVFLVSTRDELRNYREAGLPAAICIKTAFVDETVFDIDADATRQFDAIYNAAIGAYKRHELCRDIDSLALLYYRHPRFLANEPEHVRKIRAMLSHATWINELEGPYRQLHSYEVPAWLNRARTGLCLSAQEGPMRAAAEYLLCGLPVVSTPSVGGRDRLADPLYWIEAEPTPEAVAAAVRTLIARRIDRHLIRQRTVEKLSADRKRLIAVIAAIHEREGVPFPHDADWMQLFRRGTWPFKTEAMLFAETAVAETRPA